MGIESFNIFICPPQYASQGTLVTAVLLLGPYTFVARGRISPSQSLLSGFTLVANKRFQTLSEAHLCKEVVFGVKVQRWHCPSRTKPGIDLHSLTNFTAVTSLTPSTFTTLTHLTTSDTLPDTAVVWDLDVLLKFRNLTPEKEKNFLSCSFQEKVLCDHKFILQWNFWKVWVTDSVPLRRSVPYSEYI